MTDSPPLLAMHNPRVSLWLAFDHYLTTPEPRSWEEYEMLRDQVAEQMTRLHKDSPPEAVAMVWSAVDRLLDYVFEHQPELAAELFGDEN